MFYHFNVKLNRCCTCTDSSLRKKKNKDLDHSLTRCSSNNPVLVWSGLMRSSSAETVIDKHQIHMRALHSVGEKKDIFKDFEQRKPKWDRNTLFLRRFRLCWMFLFHSSGRKKKTLIYQHVLVWKMNHGKYIHRLCAFVTITSAFMAQEEIHSHV